MSDLPAHHAPVNCQLYKPNKQEASPMPSPKKTSNKGKTATAGKPATKAKTATRMPTATAGPAIEFRLFAPDAQEVCLTGDFSDWQPEACRMQRFKDGTWKKMLKLKPGRYEYRFVVDGQWWTDPENPQRQYNPFGQENSVLIVP
jgi:1,4-alpha-glucan branching enzyme